MWKLANIYAENFSAFKTLNYSPLNEHATLIFGNNMDNDSQKSNGSGKSALIEAIAVGLTGATLRNIKTEEIINDNADEAFVSLTLVNDYLLQKLFIKRVLSRKNPQAITVQIAERFDDNTVQDVPQASVAEYNKYILDTLGLSKDDIYANYILSKHKYNSFLSSSDKEKKEIINRFSNGVLVDESIAALEADMIPVEEKLREAETTVANYTGRVSAITEQIEESLQESVNRSKAKAERIESWKNLIVENRAKIRQETQSQEETKSTIKVFNDIINNLNDAETKKNSVEEGYSEVTSLLKKVEISLSKDYTKEVERLNENLTACESKLDGIKSREQDAEKAVKEATKAAEQLQKDYDVFEKQYSVEYPKVGEQINELLKSVRQLEDKRKQLLIESTTINNNIAYYHKQLAGVITCPKCGHEFTLANDVNIDNTRKLLHEAEKEIENKEKEINTTSEGIEKYTKEGRETRESQRNWESKLSEWSTKLSCANSEANKADRVLSSIQNEHKAIIDKINGLESDIADIRTKLFDEAFNIVESVLDSLDAKIEASQLNVDKCKGAIQLYEESIEEAKKASDNDMIETFRANKEKYESELTQAISNKNAVESELNTYKSQSAIFTEFKTHLANSKIEALSQITNEFLEKIGSDIRIAFSGFTVLKSGKVRDKISISLLRNGINCGSFDKFSEGEKTRANLANILAMHKLTNVSCPEGKGLDLLVLDEILDATDEVGLANIFETINNLGITALIVSHGNIAENYPHKLIVNKQNGVSFI